MAQTVSPRACPFFSFLYIAALTPVVAILYVIDLLWLRIYVYLWLV